MKRSDQNILNDPFLFDNHSDELELIVVNSFEEFEFPSTTPTNISITQIPDIIEEKEVKTIITRKHKSDPQITFEEKSLSPSADTKTQMEEEQFNELMNLKIEFVFGTENKSFHVNNNVQEQKDSSEMINKEIYKYLCKLVEKKHCNTFTIVSTETLRNYTLIDVWKRYNLELSNLNYLKEIFFQVIWGLMVAQEEMRFIHTKLHCKSVYVKNIDKPQCYILKNRKYSYSTKMWCCKKYEVKICNFENAQIGYAKVKGHEKIYGNENVKYNIYSDLENFISLFVGFNLLGITKEERDELEKFGSMLYLGQIEYKYLTEILELDFFNSLSIKKYDISQKMDVYSYELW